jgi:hypothetical protein
MESPLSFAKGMTKGTGSLLSGVATGVASSTANIVGSATGGVNTLARGVASFSGDEKFLKQREDKKRELKSSRGGVLSGFKAGGESFVSGLSSGITGLVTKPLEEGRKTGALGFIKGMGQGLVGAAVKPVMGVTEGISNVATGISNQFSDAIGCQQVRPARAFLKRDLKDSDLILIPLDLFSAKAQAFINDRATSKTYKDEFIVALALGFRPNVNEKHPYGLVLSSKYFAVVNRSCECLQLFPVAKISHVTLIKIAEDRYALEIVEYDEATSPELRRIPCAVKDSALDAYRKLYHFRAYFGNPSAMQPVEEAVQTIHALSADNGSSPADSSSATSPRPLTLSPEATAAVRHQALLVQYTFGAANKMKPRSDRMNASQLFQTAAARFSTIIFSLPVTTGHDSFAYHKQLDDALWAMVCDWTNNHDFILNASRCCACLIINHSHTSVQLRDIDLKEGADVVVIGVAQGYDEHSKVVFPAGGAVVVFAYGKRPTIISKEHVKMKIKTSAFSSMVATREFRSECSAEAGFSPCFLEKTRTDWWAKYVICIT